MGLHGACVASPPTACFLRAPSEQRRKAVWSLLWQSSRGYPDQLTSCWMLTSLVCPQLPCFHAVCKPGTVSRVCLPTTLSFRSSRMPLHYGQATTYKLSRDTLRDHAGQGLGLCHGCLPTPQAPGFQGPQATGCFVTHKQTWGTSFSSYPQECLWESASSLGHCSMILSSRKPTLKN